MIEAEQRRRATIRRYDWSTVARPTQRIPEGDWRTWLVMAGRGWGKTRTGAETVRAWSESFARIALVAPTVPAAREVMVTGVSGVLAVFPRDRPAVWQSSLRRILFPSGSIGTIYTADEPDALRGPEHEKAWADELASWRYPEAWDMLLLGLRHGPSPQVIATTTPKPLPIVRRLRDRASTVVRWDATNERVHVDERNVGEARGGRVVLTIGTTYENTANLAPQFIEEVVGQYEGTRLGRQELLAEILEEVEGALWSLSTMVDPFRVDASAVPELDRVVVAVDPAVTATDASDQTGLAVAGRQAHAARGHEHYYVGKIEGVTLTPRGWAMRAAHLYDEHNADAIVVETNNGGDLVVENIRQIRPDIRILRIVAKRAKVLRAEPIVNLYEQGRVHHVGVQAAGEEQMSLFPVASEHDDMVDALVYALTELSQPVRVWTAA